MSGPSSPSTFGSDESELVDPVMNRPVNQKLVQRTESFWKGGDVGRGFGSVKVKRDAKLFPIERLEVFEDLPRLPALFDVGFAVHRLRK